MTLLAVERIKLFTTRSPLWCTVIALAAMIGFAALMAGVDSAGQVTIASTQYGYNLGLVVVMVMAALAITTEYRFSTIKATFQAIPNRTAALTAKPRWWRCSPVASGWPPRSARSPSPN
jgi:ABC-2 type transport system permease protein